MSTAPLMKVGRYEIKEKIAAGGMATVYKAVQTGIGGFKSLVAVKVLHSHLAQDRQFKRMFLEEARIGALLNHRCLVTVTDSGEEEGISYLVTEYFPSLTLEDLVSKAGRLPLHEALYVMAEVSEGLHALHEAREMDGKRLGLVHRDVSPHNILVGNDGRVKLIDFGIVKKADPTERTLPGVIKGKARYMAPEQASGGQVDCRTDLYALGLVVCRCLTGKKPHGDGGTGELLARARNGIAADQVLKKLRLPQEVEELLRDCLSADASHRPNTAGEVGRRARDALYRLATGYDSHSFESYLEFSLKQKKARGPAKADEQSASVENPKPHAPRPSGVTVHPKWVFATLVILFGIAALMWWANG